MSSNIFQNNNSGKFLGNWRLTTRQYWDYHITENAMGVQSWENCLIGEIDPNIEGCLDLENNRIYSTTIWEDAVSQNVDRVLDFGFAGLDNKHIDDYDPMYDDLKEVFANTPSPFENDDHRFFMKPIGGYFYDNPPIDYSWSVEEENGRKFFNFMGGGLQGIYMVYGGLESDNIKYQTLPNRPERSWTWEFLIRPRQMEIENTMNSLHPNNYGFFFYQGLRAENKFWYFYKQLNEENLKRLQEFIRNNPDNEYFLDDYLDIEGLSRNTSPFELLETSAGIPLNQPNTVEFRTNNKFVFFNRTEDGFTTKSEDIPDEVVIQMQRPRQDLNFYTLFNRTESGLTTQRVRQGNFPEILGENFSLMDNTYNIYADIYGNNIGFRITKDGKIGYRMLVCDPDEWTEDNPIHVVEEYSRVNIINYNEWNYIVIRMVFTPELNDPECSNKPPRTGKIYIYNNGRLVFISEEIEEPIFRHLNEHWTKQVGVPFNISLGCGSQGLTETILSENPDDFSRYLHPIQEFFCGSFYSDIQFFRLHNCDMNFRQIRDTWNALRVSL